MKQMIVLTIVAWAMILIPFHAYASDIDTEFYFQLGAMSFDEDDHPTAVGNKAFGGLGINLLFPMANLDHVLTFGANFAIEPTDEAWDMFNDEWYLNWEGGSYIPVSGDFNIFPFIGFGYKYIRRNTVESTPTNQKWGNLGFVPLTFGAGAEFKAIYCKLGAMYPILSTTDSGHSPSGDLGLIATLGYDMGSITLEGVFEEMRFDDDGSQGSLRNRKTWVRIVVPFIFSE